MRSAAIPEFMWRSVSELIAHSAGLHFPPERRPELERGLTTAAAELGFPDTHSCMEWLLEVPASEPRLHTLVSHLASGDTYFFRERNTFDALAHHVLPELIRRGKRSLRIWSAACSTGEEPYSLAMLVQQILPDWHDWDVTILGTDINEHALHKAAEGVYGQWSFRNSPPGFKDGFFTPVAKGRYAIREEIRRCVRFARLNLAQETWPSLVTGTNAMDLILCSNVLMYFSDDRANKVAENLLSSLTDKGWLAVSPSECSQTRFAQFTTVNFPDSTLYRKPAETLYASFARALASEGKLPEALDATERWIAADRTAPAAHYLQAMVRQDLGHREAARRCLQRVTYLQPDFVLAHFAMGNMALGDGRLAEANRHFVNALDLLQRKPPDELLPESDGTTAAALAEIIGALLVMPQRRQLAQGIRE